MHEIGGEVNCSQDDRNSAAGIAATQWRLLPASIQTRWAATVDPGNPWPEYPRPQMVRPNWQNLNGLWEYAITPKTAPAPVQFAGHILVPYPVESSLSGVKKPLLPDQVLWYRHTFNSPVRPAGHRVLLHFGAVDHEATIYINGREVGSHRGGYQNFCFDISNDLKTGANELLVKVHDPTEQGGNPHGKQHLHARWMFYSASSGIWQTVWMECVPRTYIQSIQCTSDVDRGALHLEVDVGGEDEDCVMEAVVRCGGKVTTQERFHRRTSLQIEQPRLWSPEDPFLYDLEVRLLRGSDVVDQVSSYFGLRKIEIKRDSEGRARIYLNDRCTYNHCVVDQGFWPDGLYTPASDAALEFDVKAAKALGFNTVRKHIKVESQRWYYHCDRLGLMVWQDMPYSSNDSTQARGQFEQEIEENVQQLYNHPSITTWVLFNEGWGAYDQERLAKWLKQVDASRLVNGHSGPYDQVQEAQSIRRTKPEFLLQSLGHPGPNLAELQAVQYRASPSWMVGDMVDMHFYPGPEMFAARSDVASVTGEHGSFGVYIEGHVWNELGQLGRGVGASGMTPAQMLAAYANSIERLKVLQAEGLSGSAYFQLFDVEDEQQGLITYDRACAKVPVATIAQLNAELVAQARNYEEVTKGFVVNVADQTPEPLRYATLCREFNDGSRDLALLRRLALMAQRQGDRAQASVACDEFIGRVSTPYTQEIWANIIAMTSNSHDRGFQLLCTRAEEANALVGPQVSERKILEIIRRELILPYWTEKHRVLDWEQFETFAFDKHGKLGREAAIGARMMECLLREDWAGFDACFVRYFETALPRSPYCLHSLSYRVLMHLNDMAALQTAVRVMRWQIDAKREWPVCGRFDPVELDTYANLLHKCGRTSEARQWQEQAVELSDGRDQQIVENLRRMTAAPTGNSDPTRTSVASFT